MDQIAFRESLPPDTARLFERDAQGQVLWFSGPPLPPGAIRVPEQPSHSLEYLAWLVKKRAGAAVETSEGEKRPTSKRFKVRDTAEAVEALDGVDMDDRSTLWWARGLDADQIVASLKAVVPA